MSDELDTFMRAQQQSTGLHPTAPAREKNKASAGDQSPAGDALGAEKKDVGKPLVVSLFMNYFPRAILAVVSVSEYGMRKYRGNPEGTGWQKVEDGARRYGDAIGRHIVKEKMEGPYDDSDSGLSHAAQHAWNALARLEIMLANGTIENRCGNELDDHGPILGTARKV